jgi:ribosomal protein L40E
MSSQICKHCQAENPVGSRFCNNCGQTLPPGTHFICPKCAAQNPRHLLYCDKCGTRLVKETPVAPEDKKPKPEAKPPVGSQRAFSLPSRPPGDTGELDPDQLPDWLKMGQTAQEDGPTADIGDWLAELDDLPMDAAAAPGMEWLSESAAEEAPETAVPPDAEEDIAFDDFPLDWLTDEEEDSTAAAAPEEDLPDWLSGGLVEDEPTAAAASKEDLPDWLSGGFVEDEPTAAAASKEDLPDWLSGGFVEDEPPAAAAPKEDLPDWLSGGLVEDEPTAAAEPDFADWLGDDLADETAEQLETTAAPDFDDWADDEDDSPAAAVDDDLPDWLRDDLPQQPETPTKEPSLTDWLRDDVTADKADDAEGLTGFTDWLDAELLDETADPLAADDADGLGLTDWLASDTAADGLADEEGAAPPTADVGFTDWLDAELLDETADPSALDDLGEVGLTDWLASDTTDDILTDEEGAAPSTADAGFTDWLDAALGDDLIDETAAPLTARSETGLTDWLDAALVDDMAADAPGAVADAPGAVAAEEIPDWLTAEAADEADDFALDDAADWFAEADDPPADTGDLPTTGALPDWLMDMAPRGTGILSMPETEHPEVQPGLTEGLDWLRVSGQAPDEAEDLIDAAVEDWDDDETLPETPPLQTKTTGSLSRRPR